MRTVDLNDNNFLLYAASVYDNPNYIQTEFEEDLKRIKYIKRLIKKYKSAGILKERLLLNHIIVLTNVFGVEPAVRMLFFKTDIEDYPVLKTFLLFLNMMPKHVLSINGTNINSADVTVDMFVGKQLRETTKDQ
jgi:hypothetical protein